MYLNTNKITYVDIVYRRMVFHPNLFLLFFNRESKQGDLAEQLESVAYVLCGDQPISLQKFYQIFQAKGVSKPNNDYGLLIKPRIRDETVI